MLKERNQRGQASLMQGTSDKSRDKGSGLFLSMTCVDEIWGRGSFWKR
jgi:hypothetical protein